MTFPGQGGQQRPPINVANAQPLVPGVQAGVTGAILLGVYVVVFGATGGIFIYTGTPALGNPPIYSFGNTTTDPFGNTIITGIVAGLATQTQVQIHESGPGTGIISFVYNSPHIGNALIDANVNAGGGGNYGVVTFIGPANSLHNDVALMLAASSDSASSASLNFQYVSTAPATFNYGTVDVGGFRITPGYIQGIVPGSSPATADSWNTVTPPAGWSGTLRYKAIGEQNMLIIQSDISNATGTSPLSLFTLPAAYQPANDYRGPVGVFSSSSSIRFNVTTGGAVQTLGTAGCTEIDGTWIIPLD